MTLGTHSNSERFWSQLGTPQGMADPLPVLELDDSALANVTAENTVPLNLGLMGLVELILKRRDVLDRLIRDPRLQPVLVPRFLAISLIGFVFFGVSMSLVLTSSQVWPELAAIKDRLSGSTDTLVRFKASPGLSARWLDGSAWKLTAAYAFGLIATTGVCLPSLYFYGLLAGVRMSLLDVAVQALKSKATSAVALVGILPIYAAVGLGIVVFQAPEPIRVAAYWLGLVLPFVAGLWGTSALHHSFAQLCDTLPVERRFDRACFLRRLVASWGACFTAVSPVMIYTIWERLSR